MAKAVGATAYAENFEWDDPLLTEASVERIRAKIAELKPTLVTAVHCETPCGSINNRLGEIGIAAKENGALFCVDAVSSFVGMPVHVDVRIVALHVNIHFFFTINSGKLV